MKLTYLAALVLGVSSISANAALLYKCKVRVGTLIYYSEVPCKAGDFTLAVTGTVTPPPVVVPPVVVPPVVVPPVVVPPETTTTTLPGTTGTGTGTTTTGTTPVVGGTNTSGGNSTTGSGASLRRISWRQVYQ